MNYYVEGNIDFYKELFEAVCDNTISKPNDNDNIELCLITDQPLTENFITLSCNHKFNYLPLFEEIKRQKNINYTNYLETTHLKINEIKCPYCRSIQPKLLPYISSMGEDTLIKGVTIPKKYSMNMIKCPKVIKYGKRKGKECGKNCDKFDGFCKTHIKLINNKEVITNDIINKDNNNKDGMDENNLLCCTVTLKYGKRKGNNCNAKSFKNNMCKRHYNLTKS